MPLTAAQFRLFKRAINELFHGNFSHIERATKWYRLADNDSAVAAYIREKHETAKELIESFYAAGKNTENKPITLCQRLPILRIS